MKKILIASITFIIIIIFIIFITSFRKPKQATITVNNQSFTVEVVDTDDKRAKGLSGRKSIDGDQGMLFVFAKADFYSFWMKEMNFPIDIIFIRDDKIVTIYQSVPKPGDDTALADLPLYQPREAANYVLEVNAGLSQKYSFKEGGSVEMTFP